MGNGDRAEGGLCLEQQKWSMGRPIRLLPYGDLSAKYQLRIPRMKFTGSCCNEYSRDSAIGTVTRPSNGRPKNGSSIPIVGKTWFSLLKQLGHNQPPIPLVAAREADHSPPSGAEVRNAWGHTSTFPYVSKVQCLTEQDSFFPSPLSRTQTIHITYSQFRVFNPILNYTKR